MRISFAIVLAVAALFPLSSESANACWCRKEVLATDKKLGKAITKNAGRDTGQLTRLTKKNISRASVGPGTASGVAKISEQWAKEWSAKNLDAVIALYAEDAVFLPATGSRVTGRAAIRDLFEKAFAVLTSDLHVQSKVTEQSGKLAYDSGEYEETATSGGVKRSGRGNYLVVFRRDGKNQWRIVEHMWTDVRTTGQ